MKRPTKKLLINAAIDMLATKGPKATTMEDIAAIVGIRPSAIYKHFKNKTCLISEAIKYQFSELEDSPSPALLKQTAAFVAWCSLDKSTRPEIRELLSRLDETDSGRTAKEKIVKTVNELIFG